MVIRLDFGTLTMESQQSKNGRTRAQSIAHSTTGLVINVAVKPRIKSRKWNRSLSRKKEHETPSSNGDNDVVFKSGLSKRRSKLSWTAQATLWQKALTLGGWDDVSSNPRFGLHSPSTCYQFTCSLGGHTGPTNHRHWSTAQLAGRYPTPEHA